MSACKASLCGRCRAANAWSCGPQCQRHSCRGKAPDPETAAKNKCGSWQCAYHGQLPDSSDKGCRSRTSPHPSRVGGPGDTRPKPPAKSEQPNRRPIPWQYRPPQRGVKANCPVLSKEEKPRAMFP
ncbi:hypothetical protein TcG_01683 [Trypanosoma cruzi]|nr:hypothetical protein TcG_01683 [Trypanosoma cruzi]